MATWSGMRHKLEQDYLAPSLRGRVQYFVTTYVKCHDQEGRAAIRVDGKEIVKGGYYNHYVKAGQLPADDPRRTDWLKQLNTVDDIALKLGMFDQYTFYDSFPEFDNQSIEKSLESDDLLVRIFAVLDRRVGKRRLLSMRESASSSSEIFQRFLALRLEAEGLSTK